MKFNIFRNFATLSIAAAALTFTACDNVDKDDRYIDMGEITAERAVLLEDFTGQDCKNCPLAHEVIEGLEEQYGTDKFIAVSIHCGDMAISTEDTSFEDGFVGLMTRQGQTIMTSYGIDSWPKGVINGGSPMDYPNWADAVRAALEQPTDIKLDLKVSFDKTAAQNGKINMQAEILSSSAREVNVQFWITENGIVAEQKLHNSSYNEEYVHNNVFRAAVYRPIKGEPVSLEADIAKTVDANIDVRWTDTEHWVADNLYVIAIVSDSKGVQQVIRVPVIPKAAEEEQ